jgi:prophage tail gpP-like protein
MYVVGIEVTIGGKRFERIHAVEIEESIDMVGKTCVLQVPTTARLERVDYVTEVETAKEFHTGDEVVVRMGYDGQLVEEFRGFVRRIAPGTPLELECEDLVYVLNRKRLQQAFRNTTLEGLLAFILADTGIELATEVPAINFTIFSFQNVTAAAALKKLAGDYGLRIYFSSYGQLVVGLASTTDGTVVTYVYGRNVIKHSLEWVDEDDVQLKVKAVSVSRDNVFTKEEVGDPEGEVRTIFFYDLADGEDLGERALQELTKYKYSGYRGKLTGFLMPICRIGNTVRYRDDNFANREGDYLVESVKTNLSTSGGRRSVTLGLKLSA